MKDVKVSQPVLDTAGRFGFMDAISHGVRQPNDICLGYKLSMFSKGFAYAGWTTLSFDETGACWVVITDARNIAEFDTTEGFGQLRHGPRKGTAVTLWGTMVTPYTELLFTVDASAAGWGAEPPPTDIMWSSQRPYARDSYIAGVRVPVDMATKISIVDRGFAFVGETTLVFDPANQPWACVEQVHAFLNYGGVTIGELRNGPKAATRTGLWGSLQVPLHALVHWVLADTGAWASRTKETSHE
jgi:hypothetical protein